MGRSLEQAAAEQRADYLSNARLEKSADQEQERGSVLQRLRWHPGGCTLPELWSLLGWSSANHVSRVLHELLEAGKVHTQKGLWFHGPGESDKVVKLAPEPTPVPGPRVQDSAANKPAPLPARGVRDAPPSLQVETVSTVAQGGTDESTSGSASREAGPTTPPQAGEEPATLTPPEHTPPVTVRLKPGMGRVERESCPAADHSDSAAQGAAPSQAAAEQGGDPAPVPDPVTPPRETPAAWCKRRRRELDLSQEELARRIRNQTGVKAGQAQVSLFERGQPSFVLTREHLELVLGTYGEDAQTAIPASAPTEDPHHVKIQVESDGSTGQVCSTSGGPASRATVVGEPRGAESGMVQAATAPPPRAHPPAERGNAHPPDVASVPQITGRVTELCKSLDGLRGQRDVIDRAIAQVEVTVDLLLEVARDNARLQRRVAELEREVGEQAQLRGQLEAVRRALGGP